MALAAVLALAMLTGTAFAEEVTEEESRTYYVYTENGKGLNVRSAPNGDIIGELNYGEEVKVYGIINDTWAMIHFMNDEPGYVNVRFLIDIKPEELQKLMEEELDNVTGDPMTDIEAEFASAVDVEDYKITARPARVTSVVNMRWIPSETGRIIAQYKATEELVVLKELKYYLQGQDPDTGDVGYIHKKFAAR
jgi:uncharacterized protein YgiM (DUF1202 family)